MSPIEGVSQIVRMPRLGKIRLGIKVDGREGKNPYPRQVDYFVCPESVREVYGDRPTELDILFPTEDPEHWAQQWLRCYSLTKGLVCRGDGKVAKRLFDKETGAIAGRNTREMVMKTIDCDPEQCEEYPTRCRRVMNLMFFLYKVPGFGVWQIDTSSFNSIVNINSSIEMVRAVCGRVAMIPLVLSYGPREVFPPGGTRKTVYVLGITAKVSLAEMQRLGQIPASRVLMPPADTSRPDDFFPAEIIAEPGEVVEPVADEPVAVPDGPPEPEVIFRDVAKLTSLEAAKRACREDFGMKPEDAVREAGYSSELDINDPRELYLTNAAVRGVEVRKPEA